MNQNNLFGYNKWLLQEMCRLYPRTAVVSGVFSAAKCCSLQRGTGAILHVPPIEKWYFSAFQPTLSDHTEEIQNPLSEHASGTKAHYSPVSSRAQHTLSSDFTELSNIDGGNRLSTARTACG